MNPISIFTKHLAIALSPRTRLFYRPLRRLGEWRGSLWWDQAWWEANGRLWVRPTARGVSGGAAGFSGFRHVHAKKKADTR